MTQPSAPVGTLACLVVAIAGAAAGVAADAPPRAESGQTLIVPDAHLDAGEVYHVMSGEDAQLVCVSDAPLQRLVAVNRRVVGYVVVPFDRKESDPPLVAGAFRIPAAAFETGVSALDDLLRGAALLDSASHPEITCRLAEVKSFERDGADGPARWTLGAAAWLEVKGRSLRKEVVASVTFRPFTWQTMGRYPGELLTVRATIELTLEELGLGKPGPPWAERLADRLRCEVFLLCNTVPQDKTLDPASPQAEFSRRLRIIMLLRDLDQPREGLVLARRYLRDYAESAPALNRLATDLLTADGLRPRGLDVALEAAKRAARLTEEKDAAILDTLAQAHFARGSPAEAVAWLRKAVERAQGQPRLFEELTGRLKSYERFVEPQAEPPPGIER
ncbi:MAG: hypothetical protein LC135_13885 [Phycisphaerae bacterium]|nr:hypothetical protein [Phycisphaerae bacterium]MCZ2400941.1 hypothetical protein [Phycisphaerae bacterium]